MQQPEVAPTSSFRVATDPEEAIRLRKQLSLINPLLSSIDDVIEQYHENQGLDGHSIHYTLALYVIMATLASQSVMLSEGKYFQIKPEHIGIVLSIGLIIQLAVYLFLSGPYIPKNMEFEA